MEYISAEEFLKQPVEVQKIFIDWWKPQIDSYDIVQHIITEEISLAGYYQDFYESGFVSLLTEGQLRKFIEDKTLSKITMLYMFSGGYDLILNYLDSDETYRNLGCNLLQAYWKVACEIAKEVIDNE
ncbi:hypothetical protein FC754_17490 [Clostridium botulinum]|nr:hypothetical protein [Clostridium botulinum]